MEGFRIVRRGLMAAHTVGQLLKRSEPMRADTNGRLALADMHNALPLFSKAVWVLGWS